MRGRDDVTGHDRVPARTSGLSDAVVACRPWVEHGGDALQHGAIRAIRLVIEAARVLDGSRQLDGPGQLDGHKTTHLVTSFRSCVSGCDGAGVGRRRTAPRWAPLR